MDRELFLDSWSSEPGFQNQEPGILDDACIGLQLDDNPEPWPLDK